MGAEAIASSSLVLRVFSLLSLVASIIVLTVSSVSVNVDFVHFNLDSDDTIKLTFNDFTTYRYVLAVAVIGAAYTLLQLPFAIYHVCVGKRMIPNGCLHHFDFFGEQMVSFLVATGFSAGFAFSIELKSFIHKLFNAVADPTDSDLTAAQNGYDKFFTYGITASALLCLGFLCMAIIAILSAINARQS